MSSLRALASDPSRDTRKAAFEAEISAWRSVEVPFASALNAIKGFQGALRRRRSYADDVEPTLGRNAIDRPTLEAMQAACVESFPDFRRYLAAKGKALGIDRMALMSLGLSDLRELFTNNLETLRLRKRK